MEQDDNDKNSSNIVVSEAPARLCLFGEHQDYLNLPVIACSLPLFCRIRAKLFHCKSRSSITTMDHQESTPTIVLHIPQLQQRKIYNFASLPPRQTSHTSEPDFALAAIYVALDRGWKFSASAECTSTTEFPMQAGLSSSSAFCVAFCHLLAHLAQQSLTALELAQLAHETEVTHFGAPGGTMDHLTSAMGGMLRIGPDPWLVCPLQYEPIRHGVFVVAYSGEPKDTMKHLHRCKQARLTLLHEKLSGSWNVKDDMVLSTLTPDEMQLFRTTITNREMEQNAAEQWDTSDAKTLGQWMQAHHNALRDGLLLSTNRLEAMNQAALQHGAHGFKLVGSGGGGCGVAWTSSENAEGVQQAMETAGATQTWIISEPASGARLFVDSNDSNTWISGFQV